MRGNDVLPIQFRGLKTDYVQRKSDNEYSGSCPRCGGSPHPDGSLPDRLVMLVASKATGGAFAWCRRGCGFKWWEGMDDKKLTPEEERAWIEEQQRITEQNRAAAQARYEAALEALRKERNWLSYHEYLKQTGEMRRIWRARGIPNEWQDFWKLGYCADFPVYYGEEETHHTPTLTIPIFQDKNDVVNVRHRLLNPRRPNDKYRPEKAGLGVPPFMAYPNLGYNVDRILVVEGEIKAAVTALNMGEYDFQVFGIAGVDTYRSIAEKLKGRDVWICLDPEKSAQIHANQFAAQVKGRVFQFPVKIDDGINSGHITKKDIMREINLAKIAY